MRIDAEFSAVPRPCRVAGVTDCEPTHGQFACKQQPAVHGDERDRFGFVFDQRETGNGQGIHEHGISENPQRSKYAHMASVASRRIERQIR